MNKKGFTLIELLAVIVILAIIALIATPIVLNMINSARKSAAKSTALGYIDAIEYNNGFATLGSDAGVTGYQKIASGDVSTINIKLGSHLKGKAPTSGSVVIDSNGKVTSATLCISGYTVTYENNDVSNVTSGCSSSESSYVYSIETITNASDGSTTPLTSEYAYYRYELENGEINADSKPEVCFNSPKVNKELCLKVGEYDTSVQKIKEYFGYDETTWTKNEYEGNNSEMVTDWDNSMFSCKILSDSFQCNDNINVDVSKVPVVGAKALKNGGIQSYYFGLDDNGTIMKNPRYVRNN